MANQKKETRSRYPFSAEQEAEIRRLRVNTDLSTAKIAEQLGLPFVAVRSLIMGWVNAGQVPSKSNHHVWTEDKLATLIQRYRDPAMSFAAIARELGLSATAVHTKVDALVRERRLKRRPPASATQSPPPLSMDEADREARLALPEPASVAICQRAIKAWDTGSGARA